MGIAKWTVGALQPELAAGRTSSRELTEQALACIADPAGEGARAVMKVYAHSARADADHADRLRKSGVVRSPVDGLPITVKDLFDVAGDVTRAGSKMLAGAAPAVFDAPAVARLRAAGAVIVGRTNMVEFAFGVTGINPHYGTPKNPWDRATGRIPSGSSSGAGVAQADGMCVMALGSDTRGSIRLPAAMNGVVGFKPTQRRVPREGAFPLSYSLDSIGPLANTVACCVAYDAILSGDGPAPAGLSAKGLRLLVPRGNLLDDLDPQVGEAFGAALRAVGKAGAVVVERAVPALDRQAEYFRFGGLAGAEAAQIHRRWQDKLGDYDPRVAHRILLGGNMSAADYVELMQLREAYQREMQAVLEPFDAFLMPTAPCVAPSIAEVDRDLETFMRWNGRILRNVGVVNFLDGCAVSLPCHAPGTAPVGLSVCGAALKDPHVLAVAGAIEAALSARG